MQAAEVAASALHVGLDAIVSTQRIEHGHTNASWIVRTATDAVVVRMGNENPVALQIDRRNEQRVLASVSPAGIAPEVLCFDIERNVLVTRYLEGPSWSVDTARELKNIERLAHVVRELHALPMPTDVHVTDLATVVNGYAQALDARNWFSVESLRAQHTAMASQARELMSSAELRLCHNDIHHLNLVDTGRLRLLDWEYAGLGERLFDLAAIICYHDYSNAQRRLLLTHYLGQFDAPAWERLEMACRVFDYVRALWFAVRDEKKVMNVTDVNR